MTDVGSKRDLRRHPRQRLDVRVRIAWQNSLGELRSCEAACLDISSSGLSVAIPESIPHRAIVHVRGINAQIDTSASVRYCRRHGMKYLLGVEFAGGFEFMGNAKKPRWD